MIVSNLINLLGSPGTLLARKLPIELHSERIPRSLLRG